MTTENDNINLDQNPTGEFGDLLDAPFIMDEDQQRYYLKTCGDTPESRETFKLLYGHPMTV